MRFRKSKMATIPMDAQFNQHTRHQHAGGGGAVAEEIKGLIRVSKDGHVERPPIVPIVPCSSIPPSLDVTCKDVYIDKLTSLWARVYAPNAAAVPQPLPLLVYFHGGGFCVGSAAWSCYHDFLAAVASKAGCVVVSVNYRLAPESCLPAAYEDGLAALLWIKQQAAGPSGENRFWLSRCDVSNAFLAGDSAGANIAFHVAERGGAAKGLVLIQPFFGGEARTASERHSAQPPGSALTLAASDAYWRLALPPGAGRDHPWCNPLGAGAAGRLREALARVPRVMVCVAETDILRDRNVELCNALAAAGKKVNMVMYRGVGHAFQVLHNSPFAQARTQEMLSHIKSFISQ